MLESTQQTGSDGAAKTTICGGCKRSVESDSSGIVVAFGNALWHVDCFKCAKCGNRVNADTNLLLLSDGSPVCSGCSYHCSVCKLPIVDEAIMTGDDSYHALCFTCRQCSRRIEELVFAKTSQGIYCMECHNERAARSRRHHEKKKRAKAKLEEEQKRGEMAGQTPRPLPEPPSSLPTNTAVYPPPQQNGSGPARHDSAKGPSNNIGTDNLPPSGANSRSYTVPTLSASGVIDMPPVRSSSMDDTAMDSANKGDGPSLNVPASRAAKRRSLNPGLRLADSKLNEASNHGLSAQLSPTRMEAYSPSFSVESAAPSPGLVTTGSVASQASGHTLNARTSHDQQTVIAPPLNGHATSPTDPPLSAGLTERSRSTTPVPSNVDASGRASDESDTDAGVAPKLTFNDSPGQESSQRGLPPIELSFHDDPTFSNLITSFGADNEAAPLSLKDPAGSRRSMQALANVALMLSEDPIAGSTPEPNHVATSSVPTAAPVDEGTIPEESPLPPLPKSSLDTTRASSDDSYARSSSDSIPQTVSSSSLWGNNSSLTSQRPRLDSNTSIASSATRPTLQRADTADLVSRRLREALKDAVDRGATAVKLDKEFVEAILHSLQGNQNRFVDMKGRLDSMKRVSQRMFDGLSVAQEEYDQEIAKRRDAEAEVTRLRLQLTAQTAQLTALNADQRKQEMLEQMSKDMNENLHGLEKHLSKLKAERDLTLAEVEELTSTKQVSEPAEATQLSRSLTHRFENLKSKYRRDLEPLVAERQSLQREIYELKQAKDLCLEETTALVSRNDELLELNMSMTRQLENLQTAVKQPNSHRKASKPTPLPPLSSVSSVPSSATSTQSASVAYASSINEEREEAKYGKGAKSDSEAGNTLRKFPWFKGKDGLGPNMMAKAFAALPIPEKPKPVARHNFQQQSVLRFARCDYCGDKMWGTQLRCSNCPTAVHTRCIALLNTPCREVAQREEKEVVEIGPLPPSMFGRDLTEQVQSDARGSDRAIPILVEKCIVAVEERGMEYEGIYRKTGGAGQSKLITQAFERGDYESFDLCDIDTFNDISSVTSVMKNYFRSLPNPLLTFEFHELFVQAASYRDADAKTNALMQVLPQLPLEHFETLRMLMLHLHRVMQNQDINKMSARNLGVVFGPTLMRSPDSAKEFADMAGKALCIEWLVENAPLWAQLEK